MTLAAFLKDRLPALAIGALCALSVAGALVVLGEGTDAAVLAALFVMACFAVAVAWDFLRRKRFYDELADLIEQFDRRYYAAALIEEPSFPEGRLVFEALAAAGKDAADEVARAKEHADEYRSYIELWIHEVKTPIAAAHLMAANLHGPEAEKLKGELDRIESHVEQALFYARSTSLAQDYSLRAVGLAACVREACKKNARYLIERGSVPAVEVADDETVFADAKWLAFVIGQIVVNAAKYGARTIRFSARVEGCGATGRTVLEIADDGCGIPAADVPRVFDRGFTGENGRAQGSSTGMGLYLVAQLCEKMGLGVGLASEEGAGTRVMIAFPHDKRRRSLSP